MVIAPVPTGGEVHDVVILDLFDPELCVTDPCIYVEIVDNTAPKTSLAGQPLLPKRQRVWQMSIHPLVTVY